MYNLLFIGLCILVLYLLGKCATPRENIPLYDQKYIEFEQGLYKNTIELSSASALELQTDTLT
jgi:hypothetical protein